MHLVGFIIRIYRDARSPERQIIVLRLIPPNTVSEVQLLEGDLNYLRLLLSLLGLSVIGGRHYILTYLITHLLTYSMEHSPS